MQVYAEKSTSHHEEELAHYVSFPVKVRFASQIKSKHCETRRNEVSGIPWRVKVHLLMVYPHDHYLKTFDLSPVMEFKGRSTHVIEVKAIVLHVKIQLSIEVDDDHSSYCRYVIRVKFTQIWSRFFQGKRWLLLQVKRQQCQF